jgi:superfamily II DNA or RNA helicase
MAEEEAPLKLLRLDPDTAYVCTSLLLPRRHVAEGPIRGALTFGLDGQNEPRVLVREHPDHLEVPRAFLTREQVEDEMGIPLVDLRPKDFPAISLSPKPSFRFREHQLPMWEALRGAKRGVIHMGCGGGKTLLGWCKAAEEGVTTLVVSPQFAHLENWLTEMETWFDYEGTVGWIGEGRLDYEGHGIVLATIQTLVSKLKNGELPEDFPKRFGTVIFDETHHMAATDFSLGHITVMGNLFGLTATPKRLDRNEGIFFAHIGPILCSDTHVDIIPTVEVIETDIEMTDEELAEVSRGGVIHVGLLRKWLGAHPARNALIKERLDQAIRSGRTLYALSHSVDQAIAFHEATPDSGCITGKTPSARRIEQLNGYPSVFATMGVARENYNRVDINTIAFLTPVNADSGADAPELTQAIGRGQRGAPGKEDLEVLLFLDSKIEVCRAMGYSVINFLKEKGCTFRGEKWNRKSNRRKPRGW